MQQSDKRFRRFSKAITALLISVMLNTGAFAAEAAGDSGPIVVSIKPLYSLVAQLTAGVDTPVLLMKQLQSPHHYTMRPSERTLLAKARIIIWTGPQMETFLDKIIQQQDKTAVTVQAMQADGITLLGARRKHDHHEEHNESRHHPEAHAVDPHVWLSAHNAIAISRHIAASLKSTDQPHAALYEKNLLQLVARIEQTREQISSQLQNNSRPFIAFHDAFQYFENEFNLNYIDAISYDEETGPSIKHLREIRSEIQDKDIRCLVYQSPKPAIIDLLTGQTSASAVALDPLGITVNDNNNAWFEIMHRLAHDFNTCLSR